MERFQPGVLLQSPDGEVENRRTVEGHVDDSGQLINEEGVEEYNKEKGTNLTLLEGAG